MYVICIFDWKDDRYLKRYLSYKSFKRKKSARNVCHFKKKYISVKQFLAKNGNICPGNTKKE